VDRGWQIYFDTHTVKGRGTACITRRETREKIYSNYEE
jgi:hypothetical protein